VRRKKKVRPKSEVHSGTVVDGEKKRETKRSPSGRSREHKDKIHHSSKHRKDDSGATVADNSAQLNSLAEELASAKAERDNLQSQVANLQRQNQELASKTQGSNEDTRSKVEELENLLEEKNSTVTTQTATIEDLQQSINSLKDELKEAKESHEKAMETEFDKLAQAQAQITTLTEKQQSLEHEIQQLKSSKSGGQASNAPVSPRGGQQQQGGPLPAWKQRELERKKEEEEQREKESRAKLQKVASLRYTGNDVHREGNPNFKDPAANKQKTEVVSVEEPSEKVAHTTDMSEQEKIEAEMARMNRVFKKGGHQTIL